jgi:hypothetical protein
MCAPSCCSHILAFPSVPIFNPSFHSWFWDTWESQSGISPLTLTLTTSIVLSFYKAALDTRPKARVALFSQACFRYSQDCFGYSARCMRSTLSHGCLRYSPITPRSTLLQDCFQHSAQSQRSTHSQGPCSTVLQGCFWYSARMPKSA